MRMLISGRSAVAAKRASGYIGMANSKSRRGDIGVHGISGCGLGWAVDLV